MRMSGFIIGGILGAAAAMYFSRNNRPTMLSNMNWDQAVDKAGQFVRTAKSMWDQGTTLSTNNGNANNSANNSNNNNNSNRSYNQSNSNDSDAKSTGDFDAVGKMIGQDAALQQQVNEIMKEDGGQRQTQ